MAKALSVDLRRRVVDAVEGGMSRRQAAARRRLARTPSASPVAAGAPRLWSPTSRPGCARNGRSCPGTPRPPRRWTTMLKRWPAFTRFLHDGRICLSNHAAERALRGIALRRRPGHHSGPETEARVIGQLDGLFLGFEGPDADATGPRISSFHTQLSSGASARTVGSRQPAPRCVWASRRR
jgi:hypothetical protein